MLFCTRAVYDKSTMLVESKQARMKELLSALGRKDGQLW